jgi:hypothetical protein
MILIKSKQHNFRRCGISHPAQAVEYPDGRFTPAELAILKAEQMLIVEVIPEKSGASDDTAALTVEQLKTEITTFQPLESLKGMKKAELVELLKGCRANAKKE